MKRFRTLAPAGALLATAALLVPFGPSSPAAAKDRTATDPVLIHVDSVSPSTPTPTTARSKLTVTLTLTYTGGGSLDGVHILAERGDPIGNQNALDAAIADPVPPTSGLPISPNRPLPALTLDSEIPTTVQFTTSTSTIDHLPGICICATAEQPWVYPLFFTAHRNKNGVDDLLGVTSTYLPIFYQKPAQVRLSWVWPLLEPPHRFLSDTEFTDDTLAESVSTGRLSRALAVVEQVGPQIPMTLLVDPELLDELEVMSTEPYTVQSQDGKTTTPGTGQTAATEWLGRFKAVLLDDPKVSVQLTPYADPDVETLTARRMSWSTAMPAAMLARVTQALAGRTLDSTLSWPVTGAITKPTLHRLAAQGVHTVLLNANDVHVNIAEGALQPRLVRLAGVESGLTVDAALLSPAVEKDVARAITAGADGIAAIPTLVAELAVRAAQQPDVEQSVTIAAPRYIDPDVTAAVRTILETSRTTFATPTALSSAVGDGTLVSTQYGQLGKGSASATANLPAPLIAADSAADNMKLVRSLLDTKTDTDAAALVAALPAAIQRAESSAWRDPAELDAAGRYAALLNDQFDKLSTGVQFVGPSSGSYTLTSNTSPLPITISNTLPYTVHVRVAIVAQNPGFTAKPVATQIEARQTKTVRVPTTTERSGLFKIEVLLQSPNRRPVGAARTVTVRSTALGFIGVIIMIVAGTVLGVALLWRIVRRLRDRQAPGAPPADPVRVATPEPVS